MGNALVQVLVGCLLISLKVGLIHNSYCQKEQKQSYERYSINVCQDTKGSLVNTGDVIIIDADGAPRQQEIECHCYMYFIHSNLRPYMWAFLTLSVEENQDIKFEVNGQGYYNDSNWTALNITAGMVITFRQGNQRREARACMFIRKAEKGGRLTIRCKAQRLGIVTSTFSTPRNTSAAEHTGIVIICTSIVVGILIIVIIVCCVLKSKRTSAKKASKDSKPSEMRIGAAGEPTVPSAESRTENVAASGIAGGKHEANSIMTSEYAYVDHCDVTASVKSNSKSPTESDVYDHLNQVQPGQHSDNVYSTTHMNMYSSTNQESSALSKHAQMVNPSESGVYNHLNECRPSPHSDNLYNATNEGESVAMSSQYDSVELVNRQHHDKPDSDYNVLSFP